MLKFMYGKLVKMLSNERGEVVIERDADEIAAEAYAEMDNAEKGEVQDTKPASTPKKDDEKAGEPGDKSDEQGEDTKKAGDGEDANEEESGEESEGDEPKDGKAPEDKDKQITEYAEKHKLTYVEAKDDLEKTAEIIKQYKNDPAEMARAMRNKDREYSKLRSEAEKAKEKKDPVFQRMTEDQFRDWAKNKQLKEGSEHRQTVIDRYREKFPARSESMSDEAVIEEVVERSLMEYNEKAGVKEKEIKDTAASKRNELIASIAEADRRFIPDLKALLLETDDAAVLMNGDSLVQDALFMVKGRNYDADIKAAEERAMKRLKESPEIIGTKGGNGSKPAGQKFTGMTEQQKNRAIEMYGADNSDEKCFEMFKDSYKDELKKNPKFDPYKD
jgi:hypothetical protein